MPSVSLPPRSRARSTATSLATSSTAAMFPASAATLDVAAYTRVPNLDMPSLIALCRQLLTESPSSPSPAVRTSQGELGQQTSLCAEEYRLLLTSDDPKDTRPVDALADTAWGAVYRRLDAYALLPSDRYPQADRAASLQSTLFPDGLRFTQLEYGAQWVESDARIQTLLADRGRLKTELAGLVGGDFVDELLRTHDAYGEMVGATRRRPLRSKADLRILRLRLMDAASTHMIQLVATYLNPSTGDRTRDEILRSFAAVDQYRDKLAQPRRPDEPAPASDDPAAPLPPPISPAPLPAPGPV